MTRFKKFSLLVLSLSVSFFLVACSQVKTTNLQFLNEPVFDSRITIEYQDDKVLKDTLFVTYFFEPLGYTPDEAETAFKTLAEPYKNLKGVSVKEEYQDDRFVLTIEADYSKVDFKESAEALNLDEVIDGEHISYEQTLQAYKDRNYVEIKDKKFQETK